MAALGNIEEFDTGNSASWAAYCERLHFYLEANNITSEERKRAVFLSVCGNATFQLARTLVAPNELKDTTLSRFETLISEHFNPKPPEIVQRFMFQKREQRTKNKERGKVSRHTSQSYGRLLNIAISGRI